MLDREHLGMMDMRCERNAFGRQIRSFEADVEVDGFPAAPCAAVFIRAPWIAEHGPGSRSSPSSTGTRSRREGAVLAVAFHPELAGDVRVHRLLLDAVAARGVAA